MTMTTTKITKADGRTYKVMIDGEVAGTICRRDEITPGYWGRWKVLHGESFSTRRDAVAYVARKHTFLFCPRL